MMLCTALAATPQNPPRPSTKPASSQPAAAKLAETEAAALRKAFDTAADDPEMLVHNLEDFLVRYPTSSRRAQVLRTIYQQALQANDPQTAASYAEKALQIDPRNLDLLAWLANFLDHGGDAASRQRALVYAGQFIDVADEQHAATGANRPVPQDSGNSRAAALLAAGYMIRARIYSHLGRPALARADYEKSFSVFPSPDTAEELGDLAGQEGNQESAIEEYATAFAFPERTPDPIKREELRKKLGRAYVLKHGSEKGLGDFVLARYDKLFPLIKTRLEGLESPNAGVHDPFAFVLKRLDGSSLPLSAYRGKILVINFWATWCGPCRMEGKILEQVQETRRRDSGTSFLAVNVDEDRGQVPAFLQEQRWTMPVAYAEGLDHFLGVRALPTLVIFDRQGRIVFREEGVDPGTFQESLESKLRELTRGEPVSMPQQPSHPGR